MQQIRHTSFSTVSEIIKIFPSRNLIPMVLRRVAIHILFLKFGTSSEPIQVVSGCRRSSLLDRLALRGTQRAPCVFGRNRGGIAVGKPGTSVGTFRISSPPRKANGRATAAARLAWVR